LCEASEKVSEAWWLGTRNLAFHNVTDDFQLWKETTMRKFRFAFVLAAAVLIGTAWLAANNVSAASQDNNIHLSAQAHQELAQARAATAKYHNVEQALADGYVQDSPDIPGEGFHYVKFSAVDCDFNPDEPEVLHYAFVPNENRLQLVGVEYAVPLACGAAPEGFTGDADEWEWEVGGPPLWSLNAWIWRNNPDGIFAPLNPLVP
jgi:hypothetical protein